MDLDLTGLKCPLPVLRTRKALRAMPSGARLVVTTTDPLAGLDIPNLVREEGDRLEAQEPLPAQHQSPAAIRFTIRRA